MRKANLKQLKTHQKCSFSSFLLFFVFVTLFSVAKRCVLLVTTQKLLES